MQNKANACFWFPCRSFKFSNFLQAHPHSRALGSSSQTREAVAGNVDGLVGLIIRKNLNVITLIPGQYTDEMCANHAKYWCVIFGIFHNICRVISAATVVQAWTGNSQTNSPSNFLATRILPFPSIKTVCCSVFWQLRHYWEIKVLHSPFILLL